MAIPAPTTPPPDRRRSARPRLAPAAAAPRGLPLGVVLGVILSVVVALVLGTLTSLQQRREIRRERQARQALLTEALVPLAARLEEAATAEVLQQRLAAVEVSWRLRGHADHGLVVRDASGGTVAVAPAGGAVAPPPDALVATLAFPAPLLPDGRATLLAWQDADELANEARSRWRLWWLDLLVASLAVIAVVQVAVHVLVGRPLGRLVRGLRHLELGYVGDLDSGPGAWEIRWLAWRFRHLGQELADHARRLVLAERRALEASGSLAAVAEPGGPDAGPPPATSATGTAGSGREATLVRQYLEDSCRLLERLRPDDLLAAELAEEAWRRSVVEAERLGDLRLKARLDDAALRLLEPEAFADLERRLQALRSSRRSWERAIRDRLQAALAAAGVPCDGLQGRVKHTAGVWRKMTERQIELEQVHDLFAFRLLVPDEPHCYLALAAVHRQFEAEPFRFKDYIAEPKGNGYRSLHTTLRDDQGRLFEVQIRSRQMHLDAEGGAAAHWRYRASSWTSFAARRRRARWRRLVRRLLGR